MKDTLEAEVGNSRVALRALNESSTHAKESTSIGHVKSTLLYLALIRSSEDPYQDRHAEGEGGRNVKRVAERKVHGLYLPCIDT